MEEIIYDDNKNIYKNSVPSNYADLLMAIVLWDDVYYPLNKYSSWNKEQSEFKNVLIPLEDDLEIGKDESIRELYLSKGISLDDFYWLKWDNTFFSLNDDIVGCGAIRYLSLCSKNQLDYYPCSLRQDFIRKYCNIKKTCEILSRIKLQHSFTKNIEEYYQDTFHALMEFDNLTIKMPVLAKYIISNSNENMSPVDFSLHLKNYGSVIGYRRFLNEIDNAIENHDWQELNFLLKCSNDAINDILLINRKEIGCVSINLFPIPQLLFNHPIEATLNLSKDFTHFHKFIRNKKKMFNLVFLKDLTKYAVNDMNF